MISPTSFTAHAFERVRTRLSLTAAEVAELLDSDRVILIGREKDSSRIHRLFYSKRDNYCFVAVQDETTGEVVTVVPVDYRKAFAVSEEATEMAKRIILGPPVVPLSEESSVLMFARLQEMSLRFKCAFTHQGESKNAELGAYVIRLEKNMIGTHEALFGLIGHSEVRAWLGAKVAEHMPLEATGRKLYVRFKCAGKQTPWMQVKGFFEEEFL